MKKILFIAKKGQQYSGKGYVSSGLLNSAKFVVDMLRENGVDARFVHVIDNNDIDREVTQNRPDIVIIEALWVVPEKFGILFNLHPNVQWIIRIHSEVPFLAQEGIAVQWFFEYFKYFNVSIAFNSETALQDFQRLTWSNKILYLPNYFPIKGEKHLDSPDFHVGCFGAIRPLKNQLIQAIAAIRYADKIGRTLFFHINAGRVEGGQEVLKNLRSLFGNTHHYLIEHDWLSHKGFQHLLSRMNLSLCVSLSETFCLVAADSVSVKTPLVCSSEVTWASRLSKADPTSVDSIVRAIGRVTRFPRFIQELNEFGLKAYDRKSMKVWMKFVQ